MKFAEQKKYLKKIISRLFVNSDLFKLWSSFMLILFITKQKEEHSAKLLYPINCLEYFI